jgi:hypothetical protein
MTERIGNRRRFDHLPGGGYAYHLIDEPLSIEVRYLRREHGQLIAEVDVKCQWSGVTHHQGSISCADLNLSSQTARKTLAKHCAERSRMNSTGSASSTRRACPSYRRNVRAMTSSFWTMPPLSPNAIVRYTAFKSLPTPQAC